VAKILQLGFPGGPIIDGLAKEGVRVYFPPARFCTDNAAMVAGLGYHLYRAGRVSDFSLDAVATKLHRP